MNLNRVAASKPPRSRNHGNNGETLPPHDEEAEAGALACVICSEGREAERMLAELSLDDFYDTRHQEIFGGLRRLDSERKALDSVGLAQWLRDNGRTEDAGGFIYISSLPDRAPSPANFPSFLQTVKSRANQRRVLRDATDLATIARDNAISPATLTDAARRMAEAYSGRPAGLPALVDASEFVAQPFTKPDELIHGILHRGSKLVLGGGSKSFKTWTLLDLALSVAHGEPWLSFPTTRGRVLYVNFEIQPWSWQHRLKATAANRGIEIKPGSLCLWNLRGKAANFATLVPQIRETVKDDFALIILDPIYKLYGQADENKASDVAHLLNSIEDLAVSTGAAVAFGAHFSKGNQAGKESIDRISGSGVFARDPDSLLVFTKHETDDAFTVEATLRNFAPAEPFVVRWKFPVMARDGTLDPSKLKQAVGRKKMHSPDALLELLGDQSLTTKEWSELAKNESGIGNGTFYELLKELRESKRILKSVLTDKWQRVCKPQLR